MTQMPQSLDGLRVLVVDDETDIREFITIVLEAQGMSVKAVASAAAAFEVLKADQPDVLVCDIRMPGGSGHDLIRQIRQFEAKEGGHLPATAITAYQDEDKEKSLKAGFDAFLHKFAQPNEWVETIAKLAGRASA
ncbi:response regulator [Leptolyngbya ohadii]|uniref:response regulator n=1 Tax=Leptolyngbya ohadii TaxID=1962290 RepID=UPI001CED5312|nr:response regulator [Leptolyngbya ohadii]